MAWFRLFASAVHPFQTRRNKPSPSRGWKVVAQNRRFWRPWTPNGPDGHGWGWGCRAVSVRWFSRRKFNNHIRLNAFPKATPSPRPDEARGRRRLRNRQRTGKENPHALRLCGFSRSGYFAGM